MKVTLDAREVLDAYNRGLRRLYALEGFSQRQVLAAEAGVILRAWASRTPIAKPETTELFARARASKRAFGAGGTKNNPYGITVNTGRRDGAPGMVWFRTQRKKFQTPATIYSGGYISQNHLHFKDNDWARIEAGMVAYSNELKTILPASQKARGLAMQSIVQIADDLAINLANVKGGGNLSAANLNRAKSAVASDGAARKNGTGKQSGDETKCLIELANLYKLNAKIGMDRTLLQVISGRAKYIEQSYQKGAFDSMKNTVRAFPNVFKQTGLDVAAPPETA